MFGTDHPVCNQSVDVGRASGRRLRATLGKSLSTANATHRPRRKRNLLSPSMRKNLPRTRMRASFRMSTSAGLVSIPPTFYAP